MNRECKKCIYHTSGECSKWNCDGAVSVETAMNESYIKGYADGSLSVTKEISEKVIEEFIQKFKDDVFKCKPEGTSDLAVECMEVIFEAMIVSKNEYLRKLK